jgi:hypothetical protein
MPERPDRDGLEKQREIFGGELITMLEDPACNMLFDVHVRQNVAGAQSRQPASSSA